MPGYGRVHWILYLYVLKSVDYHITTQKPVSEFYGTVQYKQYLQTYHIQLSLEIVWF